MRIGIGQDSHRFDENKRLILGGFPIDHIGLNANSDGDVILHSLCNAIASGIGLGSIGSYADEMCSTQGIKDSSQYLKHVDSEMKRKGHSINNISISVECKTPKVEPLIDDIKKSISKILAISPDLIGLTATSGEGLTEVGKGLGIAVIAIVSLK